MNTRHVRIAGLVAVIAIFVFLAAVTFAHASLTDVGQDCAPKRATYAALKARPLMWTAFRFHRMEYQERFVTPSGGVLIVATRHGVSCVSSRPAFAGGR